MQGKCTITKPRRFDELELLRGLAALGVVFYHFLRAFAPPEQTAQIARALGLAIEPPFVLGLINGPFMVSIFFVLSSFALTMKLLDSRAPVRVGVAIAKRFPRLFPVTFIGAVLPAVLYVMGCMFNEEAAALTGSEWLQRSGGVKNGDKWPDPSVMGGALDSVRLFARGLSQYNSALWTMRYELLGSIAALATALLIAGPRRSLFDTVIIATFALLLLQVHVLCTLCVTSVMLTKYLRHSALEFRPTTAIMIITVGLLMGSTYKPFPDDWATDPVLGRHILRLDWLIHGMGATLVFLGVHRWRRKHVANWPIARSLGRISFSVYAIHIPVIASLGSGIVVTMGYSLSSVLVAALTSAIAIGVLSNLISRIDQAWVKMLNRVGSLLTSARQSEVGPVERRLADVPDGRRSTLDC